MSVTLDSLDRLARLIVNGESAGFARIVWWLWSINALCPLYYQRLSSSLRDSRNQPRPLPLTSIEKVWLAGLTHVYCFALAGYCCVLK